MGGVWILTRDKLDKHIKKFYKLQKEQAMLLRGYEYRNHDYPMVSENRNCAVIAYCYHADVSGWKEKRLRKGKVFQEKEKEAYWFKAKSKRRLLVLLFLVFILPAITVGSLCMVYQDNGKSTSGQMLDVIGEDKEKPFSAPNIVYQGFMEHFVIDNTTQVLSIQNSEENEGRYYTGVQLWNGDVMVYDMGASVIAPGKYININLYDLLDSGLYELELVQYGYYMDTLESVSSVSQQQLNVEVKK